MSDAIRGSNPLVGLSLTPDHSIETHRDVRIHGSDTIIPSSPTPDHAHRSSHSLHDAAVSVRPHPPQIGGVAVQTGTVLTITVVRKPSISTVQVIDNGAGAVSAAWDGGKVHSFSGVETIDTNVEGPRSEEVTYTLTGPLTGSRDVETNLHGRTDSVTANVGGDGLATKGLTFHVYSTRSADTDILVD